MMKKSFAEGALRFSPVDEKYQKSVLSNGLTVVSERIPHVRSVSLGIWVAAGSRCEDRLNNGVAHFLEHMMFKDTEKRSTREIARSLESLGGNLNAYTSKEQTCYYAEFLDDHLEIAVDLLADILNRDHFTENELFKERQVILDEILSMEDMPDEMVQDFFIEHLFPGHSLGAPISGTAKTVDALTEDDLLKFYRQYYCGANMLVVAAGNLDHDHLVDICSNSLSYLPHGERSQLQGPESIGSGDYTIERPISQSHMCKGVPGIPYADTRRYDLLILNTILSGGMGARLFQNIREKHGIAYGVYTFFDLFQDSGIFGVYLGTDQQNTDKASTLVMEEFEKLCTVPVTTEELNEAKSQFKGSLVLGLESTARRMNRLAMMELYVGSFRTIDTIIAAIDAVTIESVHQVAADLFKTESFLSVTFSPQSAS